MEYQKTANLLDDASNKTSEFKTKNWVEINDDSRATYNVGSQIKFKTTMLKSSHIIIVMHISMLGELLLLIILLLKVLLQIITIKK